MENSDPLESKLNDKLRVAFIGIVSLKYEREENWKGVESRVDDVVINI